MRYIILMFFFALGPDNIKAQFIDTYELGLAQHVRIFSSNSGFDPGMSGTSINFSAGIPFHFFIIKPGVELGTNTISNYASGSLGIYHRFALQNPRFEIESGLKTLHGAALFYQHSLYLFGLSEETSISYITKRKHKLSLFLESRFSTSPGYAEYSYSYRFFEFYSGLKYSFPTFRE